MGTKTGRFSVTTPPVVTVGGKVLKPLDEWEYKRPPVAPVDLDEIPAHVVRLSEHVRYGYNPASYVSEKVFQRSPDYYSSKWIELREAAPLLELHVEQVLRIWYSGLCDAGLIDCLPTTSGRNRLRFIRLPCWCKQEGQGLLEAVQGKERLQGFSCDTGRAGLLMMMQEMVVKPIADAAIGRKLEDPMLHQLRAHATQLLTEFQRLVTERAGRFEILTFDVRTVLEAERRAAGEAREHLLHISITGTDLVIRQPLVMGYNFTT